MKRLLLAFVCLSLCLAALVLYDPRTSWFADGRLVCAPLPPAFVPAVAPPLEAPRPLVIESVGQPLYTASVPSAKIQLEPQPNNEQLALVRMADQADWGIPALPQPTPLVIASAAKPKIITPVPTPTPIPTLTPIATPSLPATPAPTPAPTPESTPTGETVATPASAHAEATPLVPNLYLPEGALGEEGALLTLIKHDLAAYEEPDTQSKPAPFTMKEGEEVRPLTRLRNESDFDWIKIERQGKQWWAQAEYFIRVDPRNITSGGESNLEYGEEAVDKDSALPVGYAPDDMANVNKDYLLENKDVRVRREVAGKLNEMVRAASRKGLKLRVISGFRDFEHQKRLYLEAIANHGPKQAWVAAPGYSEHQLGTTIDICNTDKRFMLTSRFGDTAEGRWLQDNAEKYGFRNSYTLENVDQSGYRAEPWHFRYVGVSSTLAVDTWLASEN